MEKFSMINWESLDEDNPQQARSNSVQLQRLS